MRTFRIIFVVVATLIVACRAEAVVQGIDVSHWQGSIDWAAVRSSGIQFAYCKVSDGVGDFDATYATNLSGAIAAGVLVGPYHFAYPDTNKTDPNDAANEANYFVDLIKPYYQGSGVVLRPVLDLERLSGQSTVAAEKAFLSKWVHNFAAVVETRLGVSPLVYTNGSYAQSYYDGTLPPIHIDPNTGFEVGYDIDQYPLWFAKPTTTNDYPSAVAPTTTNMGIWGGAGKTWKFWQWSWVGSIGGVAGNVDRDVWAGSLLELAQQFSVNYSNGDYNNNGVVDAADYVVWRDRMGQTVNPGTSADGDLDGVIGMGDFNIWKANFGKLVPNIAGAGAGTGLVPAPEPSALILALVAIAFAAAASRTARLRKVATP